MKNQNVHNIDIWDMGVIYAWKMDKLDAEDGRKPAGIIVADFPAIWQSIEIWWFLTFFLDFFDFFLLWAGGKRPEVCLFPIDAFYEF